MPFQFVRPNGGSPSFAVPGLKSGLGGLRPTGLERRTPPQVLQDLSPKAPSRGFSPGTTAHIVADKLERF